MRILTRVFSSTFTRSPRDREPRGATRARAGHLDSSWRSARGAGDAAARCCRPVLLPGCVASRLSSGLLPRIRLSLGGHRAGYLALLGACATRAARGAANATSQHVPSERVVRPYGLHREQANRRDRMCARFDPAPAASQGRFCRLRPGRFIEADEHVLHVSSAWRAARRAAQRHGHL